MSGEGGADPRMARLRESVAWIRERADVEPRVAVVLGTGLGELAGDVEVEAELSYEEIPHFPHATVESHSGRLLLGALKGTPVVVMQGRFHGYEGYSMSEIARPIRVMGLLGAGTLILSGACGGMHPLWSAGDLVLLDDHINLMGDNPLVGPNLDELGPRFPDMSEPYDAELQEMAMEAALEHGIRLQRGVYAGVTGPNLETRAEYRMLRAAGADVVGMSTVPEVIAARHMDVRVLAISILTDEALPDALEPVDVPAIIETAQKAQPRLTTILEDVVARL